MLCESLAQIRATIAELHIFFLTDCFFLLVYPAVQYAPSATLCQLPCCRSWVWLMLIFSHFRLIYVCVLHYNLRIWLHHCNVTLLMIVYRVWSALSVTAEHFITRNAWQSLAYSPLGATVSPPSKTKPCYHLANVQRMHVVSVCLYYGKIIWLPWQHPFPLTN